MLITLVVDAIEWNHWIKVYIQIIIYHYLTFDHDPYDVLWVVRLVLEDMGEVKMLVVNYYWVIFNGLIFICCGVILLVVSCEHRLYDTSPFMGLVRCIVYLATNCGVAGVTET
jgi:hypothetical protein